MAPVPFRNASSLAIGLVLLLFAATLQAEGDGDAAKQAASQLTLDELRTFTDVFNQARRNYVEPVDDRSLLDSAIRGMLAELDPHSSYLSPEEFKDLDDASLGRYSGIGISVQTSDLQIVVKAVINGSPADEAGINPGDVITAIDGTAVRGRYLPDAIDELDGEPGTELTLTVLSPQGEQRELELTREYIKLPILSYEALDRSWAYFKMTQFHRDSAVDLERALESIIADGTELRGLVIDLRDNPGGVLQPAVDIADGFLEEGLIVTTRGRNANMEIEFRAQPGEWLPGIPLALLVDRGSASASEVLAGALQDHERGVIIGERTFGKGSVQSVLPLRNGGGIKLTTARYYTPSGRSIQAEGIIPDVETGLAEDDEYDSRLREADLEGHLARVDPAALVTGNGAIENFPIDELLEVLSQAGLLETGQNLAEREEDSQGPD
jgi:carboxyl-terminal processing protease